MQLKDNKWKPKRLFFFLKKKKKREMHTNCR